MVNIGSLDVAELVTLRQAAELIKVHPNTLRNWERSGKILAVRIGARRDRRFHKKTLQDICGKV